MFHKFLDFQPTFFEKKIFIANFPFLTDWQIFCSCPLKVKESVLLLKKNINFSKNRTESKMENSFNHSTIFFYSYNSRTNETVRPSNIRQNDFPAI